MTGKREEGTQVMNWRAEAISKLKEYPARRQAVAGLPAELQRVELRCQAARAAGAQDDALSALALKKELRERWRETSLWVSFVEGALEVLEPEELKVLDCFYIHPAKNKTSVLGMSPREAYPIREQALRRFTFALYGISE